MGKKPAVSAATKSRLTEAFWQLYTQKRIEQISVREITDLAGCNRGTFYLYYKDIYDILNQIEDSLLHEKIMIDLTHMDLKHLDFRQLVRQAAETFEHNRRYVVVLLGEHGDPQFSYKLKMRFSLCMSAFPKVQNLDPLTRKYFVEYCASGLLSLIQLWLNSDPSMPVEKFILTVLKVVWPNRPQGLANEFLTAAEDISAERDVLSFFPPSEHPLSEPSETS